MACSAGMALAPLHNRVQRMPEVVAIPTLEPAIFSFKVLSATGTLVVRRNRGRIGSRQGPSNYWDCIGALLAGPDSAAYDCLMLALDLRRVTAAPTQLWPGIGEQRLFVPILFSAHRLAGRGLNGQRYVSTCSLGTPTSNRAKAFALAILMRPRTVRAASWVK